MSHDPRQPDPREMTNEELCRAWEAVADHENLSSDDHAIMEEMERRQIEY